MDIACRHCSRARPTPDRSSVSPSFHLTLPSPPVVDLRHVHDFLSERSYPEFCILWHIDKGKIKRGGGESEVVFLVDGDDTVVSCHVCCKIRRTGHQTRDAVPSRGDLDLALPSADLRHPTFTVVAARAAFVRLWGCVSVCWCVCWLVPRLMGQSGGRWARYFCHTRLLVLPTGRITLTQLPWRIVEASVLCVWILCMHVRRICVRVCVCVGMDGVGVWAI